MPKEAPKEVAHETLKITPAQKVDKTASAKGSISNKFIGFAEGIQSSSTAEYARQAGNKANVGSYSQGDTVFVSIPGMRGNAEIRHREQDKTIVEAIKALNSGATLITDNLAYTNASTYNEGEKKLVEALKQAGAVYSERIVGGETLGVWNKTNTPSTPQINNRVSQLIDHLNAILKPLGLSVKGKTDMEKFFKENPNAFSSIQQSIRKRRISVNDILSSQEKSNIRTLLKAINKTGTTLLDNGEGTMYLLDHADREDIENRNPKKEEGFNCRLKFSTDGYTTDDINNIKEEIENGNIQNQKDFDRWSANHPKGQRSYNSNSIVAEVRRPNANDARLYSEAQAGESPRGRSNTGSPENFGTGFIRVYDNDGTNGPRYIQIGSTDTLDLFITPEGEVYGFVDKEGNIYLDETIISPEHPIHEYTHLWDRVIAKKNPRLWKRGIELTKQTSLWNEITKES